jgi:hypothetical protein
MWRLWMVLVLGLMITANGALVAQQPQPPQVNQPKNDPYLEGKVMRVLPEGNIVILRVGEGQNAKNIEYRVDPKMTKYWGPDREPFKTGLKHEGFKEGNSVWFRTAPGQNQQVIHEMHFYNPALPPAKK